MDLITITRRDNLEFTIHLRGCDVTSDMSVDDGGRGAGFSPAELLAGCLGACMAMTVQTYCDSNGYTDGDVGVSLTLELAAEPKRVGAVAIDIELPNGVPEDRREAIKRLVEGCPIQETFNHPPTVDVEFV
jgi:putative redox protein